MNDNFADKLAAAMNEAAYQLYKFGESAKAAWSQAEAESSVNDACRRFAVQDLHRGVRWPATN